MKNYILLFFLFTVSLQAQINFEKGYFIDNNGVKTDCLIYSIDSYVNQNNFKYKLTSSSQIEEADITDVAEFRIFISDEFFIRYKLTENFKTKNSDIIKSSNDLIYLKVLMDGNTRLLSYQNNGDIFFYQLNNDEIVRLEYYENIRNVDNIDVIIKNKKYQEQLYKALKCESFQIDTFTNLEYKRDHLVNFFVKYNECNNFDYINISEKRTKTQLNLKLNLGLTIVPNSEIEYGSTYTVTSNGPTTISFAEDFDKTLPLEIKSSILFGIELEMLLPFRKNKWSVFIAPNYQKYMQTSKTVVIADNYRSYSFENPISYSVDYSIIEIPFGIKHYMKLNENSKLFLSFSYAFVTILNKSSSEALDVEYDDFRPTSSFSIRSRPALEKNQNVAFGLGYNFLDKYSVGLNYNLIKRLNGDEDFSSNMDGSFSLIASYTLF